MSGAIKDKLSQTNTRICSGWGAIANPHAKIFDPPATPSHISEHDPGDRMKILFDMFYIFYLWEHTPKLGIKIFEIDCNWNFMIFDLLTPPQGHKLDTRVKVLLVFCSTHHPATRPCSEKLNFWPHSTLKPHPWDFGDGAWSREWKSRAICFMSFTCENTHKVWYKNLWNWL